MQLKENILFHNRYRLVRLLGQGGFSEVWLAEDTKAGMTVVLKVYAPGKGLDEDGIEIFGREFSLVFNFNHSNLLRPSHYDICERMPYLIMPFCGRGSARRLTGSIGEEEAWKFLHDVAAGLAYLHSRQPDPVIHQDIKPDNVLIDNAGQYLITDFGVSAKARSTLRKSVGNTSGGTVAYMSPERFGRDKTPIMASDIWALGATLYELLTDDAPFGEHGGLIQKSGAEIPEIKADCSSELKRIVERCLSLNAWERPTAETLVEWAEQHRRGEKLALDRAAGGKREKAGEKRSAIGWYLNVFRHYSDFSGRAGRKEFWMFFLLNAIISVALTVGAMLTDGRDMENYLICLLSCYCAALFIPSLAVAARRLHDTGKSGWWMLAWLVPLEVCFSAYKIEMLFEKINGYGELAVILPVIAGAILLIMLLAIKGNRSPNRYGELPENRIYGEQAQRKNAAASLIIFTAIGLFSIIETLSSQWIALPNKILSAVAICSISVFAALFALKKEKTAAASVFLILYPAILVYIHIRSMVSIVSVDDWTYPIAYIIHSGTCIIEFVSFLAFALIYSFVKEKNIQRIASILFVSGCIISVAMQLCMEFIHPDADHFYFASNILLLVFAKYMLTASSNN
jgi:uncharacterized membrane protein YhaH (DUF805 family)